MNQSQLDSISDAMVDQLVADDHDDPGDDWSGTMDKTYKYGQHTLADYLTGVQDRLGKLQPPLTLADDDVKRLARDDLGSSIDDLRTDIDQAVT